MVRAAPDNRSAPPRSGTEPGDYSHSDRLPEQVGGPGQAFGEQISSSGAADDHGLAEQDLVEDLLDQIREALGDIPEFEAEARKERSEAAQQDPRTDGEFTSARTPGQPSNRAFRQRVTDSPWPWLLAAAAAGYSLAWWTYGKSGRRSVHVPNQAKAKLSYDLSSDD